MAGVNVSIDVTRKQKLFLAVLFSVKEYLALNSRLFDKGCRKSENISKLLGKYTALTEGFFFADNLAIKSDIYHIDRVKAVTFYKVY